MEFVVARNHPCLPGHFPGRPVVPGVVILDHVLAAIEGEYGPLAALRLPQVKFLQPLLPGQTARIELQAVAGSGEMNPAESQAATRWRFRVLRDADTLASGEVAMA